MCGFLHWNLAHEGGFGKGDPTHTLQRREVVSCTSIDQHVAALPPPPPPYSSLPPLYGIVVGLIAVRLTSWHGGTISPTAGNLFTTSIVDTANRAGESNTESTYCFSDEHIGGSAEMLGSQLVSACVH